MLLAAFAVVSQGVPVSYGLLLYAMAGTAFLTGFMAFHGLFPDEPR